MTKKLLQYSLCLSLIILLSACGNTANTETDATADDWEQVLSQQIKLLGHRNWIVVADAAYPLQSKNGITTLESNIDHFKTIEKVKDLIEKEQHIRPIIYLDKEIDFVTEQDAKGINEFKDFLDATLNTANPNKELHEDIIGKLDEAASLFNVLIIKTDFTIPYTSVFFQLDCAYWGAEQEKSMRESMEKAEEN